VANRDHAPEDSLAAAVAHEINNPLTVVMGYVELPSRRAGREGHFADSLAAGGDAPGALQQHERKEETVYLGTPGLN
jgi:signal transduction histidine kinase